MCENNKTEEQILPKVIFGYEPIFVNTLKKIDDFKLILKKEDYILRTYVDQHFVSNVFAFFIMPSPHADSFIFFRSCFTILILRNDIIYFYMMLLRVV